MSAFYPFFPEGPLVRVHFIIARYEGETPNPDRASLEHAVASIVRTWVDALHEALQLVHDPVRAQALFARYRNAFSAAYQEAYPPAAAVGDIRVIESLSDVRPLAVDFYRSPGDPESSARLKVWSHAPPDPAVRARAGAGEHGPARRQRADLPRRAADRRMSPTSTCTTCGSSIRTGGRSTSQALAQRLQACFLVVMRGRAENDGYNALVLEAGLPWRDVALIRTISRFLRQVRVPYSQDYMWATLRKHAAIAAEIVALFHARFDPAARSFAGAAQRTRGRSPRAHRGRRCRASRASMRIASCGASSMPSRAALRTNFYQIDDNGQPKAAISIKFDSRSIEDMPMPRPLYEIFVYSPRVEGVHLRFGKVARGGLRWSDRPQDFRTEVLGLVKAQQVKNAVIVPVGSKGGFVPKRLPAGPREAIQTEGVAAYTLFVSSLLDITDNIGPEGVIPPPNVVRRDGDDPYLVVAADKGTATFSDIANGISAQYGFWLGDAFASGGSAGYDHKKMGITARGAWEAVKRHFRELDLDIMATPFTVAGVGDMSGDVFGNGMLLS